MVGERLKKFTEREPVWRQVEKKVGPRASKARNRPMNRLEKRVPQVPNRNIGGGVGIGIIGAAIIRAVKDYVPLATSVDLVDTQDTNGGVLYTLNVDAPMQDIAKAEAFMEAASGFTSVLTDRMQVEDARVVKSRVVKDTYEIKVLVSN